MIRIFEFDALKPEEILNRDIRAEASVEATVDAIIADVRARGDAALKDYALKFDHAQLDELRVSQAEIDEAFEAAGEDFVTTLKMAAANIRAFHEHQVHKNFVMNDTPGIVLGQKYTPIEKAGVYVPGGTAAYPSTVLMDVIPAKVAGVKEIVMTTPAGPDGKVNPSILAAAVIAGIDKIFKTGGLLGTVLGSRFTPALREKLTMVLGFASVAIGINSIVKANQMTPVVIAVIFGTLLGELLHLEEHITHVFGAVTRKLPHDEANFDMERYITVVVLFCASGFGIYGVLVEGMSGSPAVLQSKAVLDLCTAAVFAVTLGVAVAVIALPMLTVMLVLFFAAGAIAPFVTPEMLQDFISCGGVLTIVAGMRVSGIKQYPIANMIPALLLVLPASAIWQTLMV